jgi:hypothetical protein
MSEDNKIEWIAPAGLRVKAATVARNRLCIIHNPFVYPNPLDRLSRKVLLVDRALTSTERHPIGATSLSQFGLVFNCRRRLRRLLGCLHVALLFWMKASVPLATTGKPQFRRRRSDAGDSRHN